MLNRGRATLLVFLVLMPMMRWASLFKAVAMWPFRSLVVLTLRRVLLLLVATRWWPTLEKLHDVPVGVAPVYPVDSVATSSLTVPRLRHPIPELSSICLDPGRSLLARTLSPLLLIA